MSSTRSMFLGCFLVSPNNNDFDVRAKNGGVWHAYGPKALTTGTYYHSLLDLLHAIQTLIRTAAHLGSATVTLGSTGYVTIASGSADYINVLWMDTDPCEWLGFTGNRTGDETHFTASNHPMFSFFPDKPIGHDSIQYDEIHRVGGRGDDGQRLDNLVATVSYKDIRFQYDNDQRAQFIDFMRWELKGLPFAYYPDPAR